MADKVLQSCTKIAPRELTDVYRAYSETRLIGLVTRAYKICRLKYIA